MTAPRAEGDHQEKVRAEQEVRKLTAGGVPGHHGLITAEDRKLLRKTIFVIQKSPEVQADNVRADVG